MKMQWKSAISALATVLLFGPSLRAQDADVAEEPAPSAVEALANPDVEVTEEEPECRHLNNWLLGECFTERTGIYIEGWADGGATINDNAATLNGPVTFNNLDDFQLNQLYLIIGRAADREGCRLDWGFQADVLYGTDAQYTYALGLDIRANGAGELVPRIISTDNTNSRQYGVALPQLYGELFVPVGNGLTFKAGHFYTIIGYEVVTAPDNFFYSHAYTMQYGEPFTHTGFLAEYQVNDRISVTNGLVRGWDNWIDNNNGIAYLGGVSVDVTDSTSIAAALITGAEQDEPNIAFPGAGWQGAQPVFGQSATLTRTMYSLVLTQKIGEKLTYVAQHDHGWQNGAGNAFIPATEAPWVGAEWYGINQYLFYDLTDKLALGIRAEWFRDDDGVRVFSSTGTMNATNYYELTFGANYKPNDCLRIRPEVRYDWQGGTEQGILGPGTNGPSYGAVAGGDGIPASGRLEPRTSQFTAAMDVILRF